MTTQTRTGDLPRTQRSTTLPTPHAYTWITRRDIWLVVLGVAALLAAMWVRHGGLEADPLTAFGEVSALGGTYAALLGVLFASRAPWIDQVFGADDMRRVHAWLGFAAVWAIGAHALTSTLAAAGGSLPEVVPTLVSLVRTVPGMLGALVGMGLFVLVAVSSMRAARRRVSYETWHGIHLYVYLAVAFGFLHQLTLGEDFVADPLARVLWVGLYVVAFLPLLVHRIAWPLLLTVRHRPHVLGVTREASGVVSLYIGGRSLDRLAFRAGQFFVVRALTRHDWMHGHPLSVSAAPNGTWLRFTIKLVGEGTRSRARLQPGTRVLLEGPYGAMHETRRTGRRLLMIAGGIGIAPIRAMAEGFVPAPGSFDLVYRTPDPMDVALRSELEWLARDRGISLHLIAGRRGDPWVGPDPLGPDALRRMVPDAARRDIYLCGPDDLMTHARRSLLALGAEPARINLEYFG
ncbi:MAG: ferredoxin reductase family protein [Chloroflexota bacterium]